MKVYRVEREKYLDSTLKGIGAAKSEGFRWNSLNTYLVYTSECRALATLEVTAHLDIAEDIPNDRFYVEIEIPDELEILEVSEKDLPKNWDEKPPILETQFIGDDFVLDNDVPILKAPSAIVPQEFNYLINPNHPDSKKIKVISKEKMSFDKRISKK